MKMKKSLLLFAAAACLMAAPPMRAARSAPAQPKSAATEKTQPRVIQNPDVDSTNVEYCQIARVTVSNGQTMVTIGIDLSRGALPEPVKKAAFLVDAATGATYKYKSAIGYKAKELKEVDGTKYVTLVFKAIPATCTRLNLVATGYTFYGIDLSQDGDGKIRYNARRRAMDKLKGELPEGFSVEE